jgi:hypothetical protein
MLQGQREAGKGYLHSDGEHFVLTAGQRRYKAMRYANESLGASFEYIECDCEEKDGSTGRYPEGKELIIRQMVDGTTQERLCVEDQALNIKELVEVHGMSVEEVSKQLQCSGQHVRDMLKFNEVDPDIKQAVKKGSISATAAVKTARARKEAQKEVKEKLDRGEQVSNRDVDVADGKIHSLSVEEIQKQIKKADTLFCSAKSNKDGQYYKGVYTGLHIAIGLSEKLK